MNKENILLYYKGGYQMMRLNIGECYNIKKIKHFFSIYNMNDEFCFGAIHIHYLKYFETIKERRIRIINEID